MKWWDRMPWSSALRRTINMNLAEVKPQEYLFWNVSFISDPSLEFPGLNNMWKIPESKIISELWNFPEDSPNLWKFHRNSPQTHTMDNIKSELWNCRLWGTMMCQCRSIKYNKCTARWGCWGGGGGAFVKQRAYAKSLSLPPDFAGSLKLL